MNPRTLFRALAPALFLALLVVGCGGSTSAKLRGDGGAGDGGASTGRDAFDRADRPAADDVGASFVDAGLLGDGRRPRLDGTVADASSVGDASVSSDAAGSRDSGSTSDGAPVDQGPAACSIELRAIGARDLSRLVGGPTATALVAARVNGTTAVPSSWAWEVVFMDGSPVHAQPAAQDASLVEFPVSRDGDYSITATATIEGRLCTSGSVTATAADPARSPDFKFFRVVVIPPPTAPDLAMETLWLQLMDGPVRLDIGMSPGRVVSINPLDSGGLSAISSYIRIIIPSDFSVLDGFARAAAFTTRLSAAADAIYDVLVVPTGPDGTGVGAEYAPALLMGLTLDRVIDPQTFKLDHGVAVRGKISDSRGALVGTRVVLRGSALSSTVASTKTDGTFEVLARAGQFSLVAAPPPGLGLPQVVSLAPVTVSDFAAFGFIDLVWRSIPTVVTTVGVRGLDRRPVAGARVVLQANLPDVATASVEDGHGAKSDLPVAGAMTVEAITGAEGNASFGPLPVGAYSATILPDSTRVEAITTVPLVVSPAAAVQNVSLIPKGMLVGKLTGEGSLSNIRVTATDVGTDLVAQPVAVTTGPDGSFSIPVSPRRRYLVMAQPPVDGPFARTFVGNGPVEMTGAPFVQRMRTRRLWSARVVSARQPTGVAGAVLRIYCHPDAFGCADPSVAVAETVSGFDGSFQASLPDPSSR